MAQIVTITNPLTGQPTQVDQLEHTAQQIDDGLNIARGVSNPNLLDNWYFGNPVNQRGFSGQNTTGGYFLDRFLGYNCSYTDGVLKIRKGMFDASVNGYITQRVEPSRSNYLNGKLCTFSSIVNGDLICGTATYSNTSEVTYANSDGVRLYSQVANGLVELVAVTDETTDKAISAVKIELGTQQTLAHQDENGNWVLNEIPDYGEQLMRCQRYFYRFPQICNTYTDFGIGLAQSATKFYCGIKLPVSMRNIPSIVASGAFRLLSADFGTAFPVTSIDYQVDTKSASSDLIKIRVSVATGLAAGTPMYLQANNDTSAHIDFIADL